MRVHRYELDVTDYQQLELPWSYELLSVAPSHDDPDRRIDLWVQAPEVAPSVQADIYIVGTGNPMPPVLALEFVGTVVTPIGLVWHVFGGPAKCRIETRAV